MTYDDFNAFCGALAGTTHVVQWGGSDVWKVGGKVFAIGGWDEGVPAITFKAGDLAYEMLKAMPGLRPAPYLASRGLKWIQHHGQPGLATSELQDYLRHSYRLVVEGLPKRTRASLGLGGPARRGSLPKVRP
jgi:predicted DNA-binding protein (MmcQ/YjbR family)